MNKFLRVFLVSLLTFVSNIILADAYKTLTFPDGNSAKISAYDKTWTVTIGNDTWTIVNFNNNNNEWAYIKCGRKNNASVASIATGFIMDKAISDVIVTIDKVTATSVNSMYLLVASDSEFATVTDSIIASSITTGDIDFKIESPAANKYYKLVFDCASASSNGVIQISKVGYYEQGSSEVTKKSAALAFSESSISLEKGSEFTSPTFSKATTAEVTFSSNNESVATVNSEGVITLAGGEGTATITASSAENDEYSAGTATCKITVYSYKVYTKATTVESGKEYLIVAQRNDSTFYAYPLGESYKYGALTTGKIGKLIDTISVKTTYDDGFIITAATDGYTIQDCYSRYLYQKGTYNTFNVDKENAYIWTIEAQSDGTFKIAMNSYFIQLGYATKTTFGAYTELQTNAVLPMLYVYNEEANTGITSVKAQPVANDAIYNLAGQRVSENYRGIVIKNGKKYIQNK